MNEINNDRGLAREGPLLLTYYAVASPTAGPLSCCLFFLSFCHLSSLLDTLARGRPEKKKEAGSRDGPVFAPPACYSVIGGGMEYGVLSQAARRRSTRRAGEHKASCMK